MSRRHRHFTKDIQMADEHMTRCSVSFAIRKMQIKLQYHYTSIRIAKMKNSGNTKCK